MSDNHGMSLLLLYIFSHRFDINEGLPFGLVRLNHRHRFFLFAAKIMAA